MLKLDKRLLPHILHALDTCIAFFDGDKETVALGLEVEQVLDVEAGRPLCAIGGGIRGVAAGRVLVEEPLGLVAKQRLSVMRETEDGFRISEEDLKLRGEGELLGTRQSGTPGFRVARLDIHSDLLDTARNDARLILERDPDLRSPRGEALRVLLYLYGRDDAVRLLRAG